HTRSKRDWSSDVCSSDLAVVSTVYDVDVFRHGPRNNLVMQRNMPELISMDAQYLGNGLVTLVIIDFHFDLLNEFVDLGIGITPKVKRSIGSFARTVNQALQGVQGIKGGCTPTKEISAGIP